MEKRVRERLWPTLLLAATGFGMLAISLPEWARGEVLLFGAAFAALVAVVDDDVREALGRALHSRPRGNTATSKRAKAPASSRAAT
jgi:hypothetical protein